MEYLRRSFEGMTNWPLVVTVETCVFIGAPGSGIQGKVYRQEECKSSWRMAYMLRECVTWWRGAEHSQEWCATEAGVRKGKERVFSTSQPANIPTCFQPILPSPPHLLFWKAKKESAAIYQAPRTPHDTANPLPH